MPMPTAASKANCDASTDDPKLALLTDLATLIDKFNDLIAMRAAASGYCDLDASTLVPSARLATALAAIYALTPAANRIPYFTSASAAALLTIGTASGNVPLVGTSSATELLAGLVELATSAETVTGTDAARATHAAGVKAAIDAAIAALPAAGGMTLLGTLTTTSGTTQTLSGLTLTDYKMLYISLDGLSVSNNNDAPLRYGSMPIGVLPAVAAAYDGQLFNDLSSGYTTGSFNGVASTGFTTAYTASSTSITFSFADSSIFDAGVIKVYGVK